MRVTFVGVGAAFDETLPNTSLLVESGGTSLLLDCGFSSAPAFWALGRDSAVPDGVFLSHYHADHWFGVPALLARFASEGRTRPLTVLGPEDVEERVVRLTTMAYPNALGALGFPLLFASCSPCRGRRLGAFSLDFAAGDHAQPCLAARVDGPDGSLFYSGDGRPTEATRALASGCPVVVHESFSLEPDTPGHGAVSTSLAFAREAGADLLALVHLSRKTRRDRRAEVLALAAQADRRVLLPEPGDVLP